jgi:molybdopterin converting factor small subunit
VITVRYHALLRERLGCAAETLPFEASTSTARALLERLGARDPALAGLTPHLHVAVNDALVSRECALNDGDTVDLMPPFGGG